MKNVNPQLAGLAGTAIETIRKLLTDPDTPPPVRLRAAKLVLDAIPEPPGGGDDGPRSSRVPPPPPAPAAEAPRSTGPVVPQTIHPINALVSLARRTSP